MKNMIRCADGRISFTRTAVVLLVAVAAAVLPAAADSVTYSNPFADYGTVPNSNCGIGGICAAAEAENSFIFLNNYYPTKYQNTMITTGGAGTQMGAAMEFALGGFGFCGYYQRFGKDPCAPNDGVNGNYVDTLKSWLNTYAPGTSSVSSDTDGKLGATLLASFIGPELKKHEDVELFIYNLAGTVGHVISPTSITYDPLNPALGGSITYQDPNDPTTPFTATFNITNGFIEFKSDNSQLGTVYVSAAFAESPVPEPATLMLMGTGISGLALVLLRRRPHLAS